MANKKISALASLTDSTVAAGDTVPIYDLSATTLKRMTLTELAQSVLAQLSSGTISEAELQYLDSVTSALQTQINNINTGIKPSNTRFVSAGFTGLAAPFYTTVQLAVTAASSGETVVIYPGTYNEQVTLKNGVNLFLFPGAVISWANSSDEGTLKDNNVAVTCKIGGFGEIKKSSSAGGIHYALKVQHASSDISVQCALIHAVEHLDGTVSITCPAMGGIKTTSGKASLYGKIVRHTIGVEAGINLDGAGSVVLVGDIYLSTGTGVEPAAVALSGTGTVRVIGSILVDAQATALSLNETTGVGTVEVYGSIQTTNAGRVAVTQAGGNCFVMGDITANGQCVTVSDLGTVRLMGGRIKSTQNISTAHCITHSGGATVVLQGSVALVATHASANSINAASAQNVKVYGTSVANNAKHANVTIQVGTLVVDTNVS